jgi:pimeloyl-ACP methyl ester carboxylesterase
MTAIVLRFHWKFLTSLLVVAAAGAAGLYLYVPTLERDMTFFPSKYQPSRPWQLPAGAADVWFPTPDGVRLHGWFFTAAGPRTGITVLMLHGNAGTLTELAADAVIFQKKGFDVLVVDYRGYGRSEGRTLDETTLNLDGRAALAYLTKERGLDPATIALFGYSLGTAVATDLAVSSPCRAVALVAPVASARRQALLRFPAMPALVLDRMSNSFDTIGRIGRANCPVLVVHGTADEVIPIAEGRAVYDAAHQPKRMITLEGGKHWLANSAGLGYLDEVAAFFVAR